MSLCGTAGQKEKSNLASQQTILHKQLSRFQKLAKNNRHYCPTRCLVIATLWAPPSTYHTIPRTPHISLQMRVSREFDFETDHKQPSPFSRFLLTSPAFFGILSTIHYSIAHDSFPAYPSPMSTLHCFRLLLYLGEIMFVLQKQSTTCR